MLCYSLISKQYPIITIWNKFFFNLFKIVYIKKPVHKYSQPLLNTLLKHLWHQLQPQILGMMRKALIIIIWQFSSILLLISSPLKLCKVGWGQTHILRFLQKYWLAHLRLWPGHSRIFTDLSMSHFCCVFRAIVLSEVLNALDWVSLRSSQYFSSMSVYIYIFYSDVSLSPCHWKQPHAQHEAATSTLYFWDSTLYNLFIALAHRDLPLLDYAVEFSQLALLTAFGDATLNSLFWIRTNHNRPVDLPDCWILSASLFIADSPWVCPSTSPLASSLEDSSSPPPANEAQTPPQSCDPAAPPWLPAPSSPHSA